MERLLRRLANKFSKGRTSYSQCGEDMIVDFIMSAVGVESPTYLDIGANQPCRLNNTYYFYRKGCRGVCVEPDPKLCANVRKARPGDTCLNIGVGLDDRDSADFYLMTNDTLNTFSAEEAERYQRYGTFKIEKVIKIGLKNVNTIIAEHFGRAPNFISIDVEGLDYAIVSSFDFARYRPQVFCIETLTYTEDKSERKCRDIIDYMAERDYMIYADTYINTIFVDRATWTGRAK